MHSVFDGVETLLLDLDGTLLDLAYDNYFWEELIPAAYAAEHGLDPEAAVIEVRERIARERGTLNWYSLKFWTRALELDVLALKRSCADRIGYLEGAPAFLETARASGYRLVLVTNSARALLDIKHDRTGVCHYMDAVYSS
ncbi:MAG: haloacid dehalogenase-like hydrolase, partial [Pseudomonadota bacterium]